MYTSTVALRPSRAVAVSALVVVGNKNGKVGVGLGKAKEVSEAIRKGTEAAQRNIVEVQLLDGTIPHDIEVKSGATRILLMPAAPGATSSPRFTVLPTRALS